MPPAGSASGSKASTSSVAFSKLYNGSFLPSSLGNGVACYSGATFPVDSGSPNDSSKDTNDSKGKGKDTRPSKTDKGKAAESPDGAVKFVEFDTLKRSRRAFTTETYTVYASLQIITNKFRDEALEDMDHRALALRNDDVPKPEQVAYFSRFMQLYRDSISRYLLEISSQDDIDTEELSLVSAMRDTFHLAHLVYVPADGRGDGIASEEIVDWLNTTSPFPSAERRENLTTMAAPYEDDDFWPFIYSCVLRGHFELASTILDTLSSHPSSALVRLTQACADLLGEVPRSTSPIFSYETAFLQAVRSWRNRATSLSARLEVEMDEFQEEIEALEDSDADACADERLGWQSGFSGLLKLLTGDANAISEASEDGWRSALAAWCLLVRPGLKRDDLPETIDAIVDKNPLDQTLFKEAMSIALLSGDIPKVLRLAAEEDSWLVTHLCDMFAKLGLLRDSVPVENVSLRDWFILSYTEILMSDSGLWRVTVDYLASLDNLDLGLGRMREYLLSIGSTSPIEASDPPKKTKKQAVNGQDAPSGDAEGEDQLPVDGMDVVVKVRKETTKKLKTSVEDVLAACAMYGLEDVARSVCTMTAEALVLQKKYGHAIAYCVRANDGRRINKICDLILDEYIINGDAALALIDTIPTSLLRPSTEGADGQSGNGFPHSAADMFQTATPGRNGFDDHDMEQQQQQQQQQQVHSELHRTALALVASTRLGFLARYRDFHALYAAGERAGAAELLVLLMSSNAAPKQFWAVMLLDSVALLNADEILVSEQDTLELMRCLNEIVTPIEMSGKRDIYGHLTYLTRAVTAVPAEVSPKDKKQQQQQQQQQQQTMDEKEKVEAALRQLEVVRYSLTQNIARCFMQS